MIKSLTSLAMTLVAGVSIAAQNADFYTGGAYESSIVSSDSERYSGGTVSINGDLEAMKLRLNLANSEFFDDYRFENARTRLTNCDVIETRAMVDRRPVDGPQIKITVLDNRQFSCPTIQRVPATQVIVESKILDRFTGEDRVERFSFTGSLLSPVGGAVEQPFEGSVEYASYAAGTLTLGLYYEAGLNDEFRLEWGDCQASWFIAAFLNSEVKQCRVELVKISEPSAVTRRELKEVTIRPEVGAAYLINLQGIPVLLH